MAIKKAVRIALAVAVIVLIGQVAWMSFGLWGIGVVVAALLLALVITLVLVYIFGAALDDRKHK